MYRGKDLSCWKGFGAERVVSYGEGSGGMLGKDSHLKSLNGDLPGGPVVKTPGFHVRECRFDHWSRN